MIDIFIQEMLSHAIQSDVPHYKEAFQKHGGPLLELGVGLGRTFLPLAESKSICIGIDNNAEMINKLQTEIDKRGLSATARLENKDITEFHFDSKFKIIQAPLRVLQLLRDKTERLKCLKCCKQHIMPEAHLILHITEMQAIEVDGAWRIIIEQSTQDGGVIQIEEALTPNSLSLIGLRHKITQYDTTGQRQNSWLHSRDISTLNQAQWTAELHESGFQIVNSKRLSNSDVLITARPMDEKKA